MDIVNSTVQDFIHATASKEPTPGGGAVAGITAATGAALVEMVANLTVDKSGYEDVQADMKSIQCKSADIRNKALQLAQADTEVFNSFMAALALPKSTDEEKEQRTKALQDAYREAASVPLELGKLSYEIFALAHRAAADGNVNLVTDAAIAAINARAAVKSAFLNVRINLKGLRDQQFVEEVTRYMNQVESTLDEKERQIIEICQF